MSENPCPRWLHWFAVFVAFATFLLVIAGALVTSNDAGLSVPDWPLAFGKFAIPRMVGGVRFEFGHRLVAGTVGFLTFGLALALWRFEKRRWVRWLGVAAALTVVAQAVLGGIAVLDLLPPPLAVSHAALAEIFFCIMVSLALFTYPRWRWDERKTEDSSSVSLRRLALATTIIIYVQIILGACFRLNAFGVLPHMIGAVVVTFVTGWLVTRVLMHYRGLRLLRFYTLLLGGFVIAQIFLGIGSYVEMLHYAAVEQPLPPVVDLTTTHLAVGALTLAVSLIVTYQSYRFTAVAGKTVPAHSTAEKVAL